MHLRTSPIQITTQASRCSVSQPQRQSSRDPWLDNARFILISLVILGHWVEPLLGQSEWLNTTYRFLYLFHMPAFAFLSGTVACADADARLLRNVTFRLLLPYAVFQGLYTLAAQSTPWPDAGPDGVATPYWILWYLLSLAGWRLMLPLFARLRRPLLLAVTLAVVAGCASDVGYYLSISRTLVFFPLFLIGWSHGDSWRSAQRSILVRTAAVATLAMLLLCASSSLMDTQWLYGSLGYTSLGTSDGVGILLRLLQLAAAVAGTAAFLALIPQRPLAITPMGARSLPAYLLHGFLVKFAIGAGVLGIIGSLPSALIVSALVVLTLGCAFALSTPIAQRVLSTVVASRWLEQHLWRQPS